MKKILALSALALAMSVGASATTILVTCGQYSVAGLIGDSVGTTLASGSISCPGFTVPGGSTVGTPTDLIFNSDFSSGAGSTNTTTTTWGTPINDTGNVATGFIGSSNYSTTASGATACPCAAGSLGTILGPSYFEIAFGGSNLTGGFTVTYSDSLTAGSVQTVSGNVFEIITYAAQVTSPEPTTFVLMGAGLGLLGMLRRRSASKS
jgi:hypothetical protein